MNMNSRRNFIAGMTAAAGAYLVESRMTAQTRGTAGGRRGIDVHHHITPPPFLALLKQQGQGTPVAWTLEKSLEDMDRGGTAIGITSITSPGIWFGDVAGVRKVARDCNEYAAKIMADHPGRFGI